MVRKMLAEMQPFRKIVRAIARNCSNWTIFLPARPSFRKIVRVARETVVIRHLLEQSSNLFARSCTSIARNCGKIDILLVVLVVLVLLVLVLVLVLISRRICDREASSGTPSPGVIGNALRENRLVIFCLFEFHGLCSIRLRRHGPFISCHVLLPRCFSLSGTHLGSSFFSLVAKAG